MEQKTKSYEVVLSEMGREIDNLVVVNHDQKEKIAQYEIRLEHVENELANAVSNQVHSLSAVENGQDEVDDSGQLYDQQMVIQLVILLLPLRIIDFSG